MNQEDAVPSLVLLSKTEQFFCLAAPLCHLKKKIIFDDNCNSYLLCPCCIVIVLSFLSLIIIF